MDARIQVLAIIASAGLLVVVLELVRRRRLQERYALLWLVSAVFLLALACWRDALDRVASLVGIAYPPNALFFLAFAAILVVLLHFSVVISRLSDQTKVLAQRLALLDERLRRGEQRLDPLTLDEDAERLAESVARPRVGSGASSR
jgi:hypothetical protein